ncbi:TPR-like protein [Mycena sanguinolenta]|uniref:TPR-like protein n=1 Tax=Mycena sanguinolenta TaxID=230812 RepID=A0A8H6XGI9_9AGAR|nr:TPR-like protein [Mycena sanguinolenta]
MEPSGGTEMLQQTSMVALSQQLEGTILSPDHFRPLQLSITGGQGGSGGQGHPDGTGGPGGAGMGPTVNITAQQLTLSTFTSDQASQQSKIQAAQMSNHCPPPSRIFQGRRDILDKMQDFFTSSPRIQKIYLLHGLGGAGKTQIALKFIKDLSSRFSDIFFIDTSTIATIDAGLKNIAIVKEFGDSQQDGLQWLTSKVEEWIILFDNADDPSINLHDFIPECDHGNIIITSRNPALSLHAGSLSLVGDMEEADATALLLKSAGQKATVCTKQIAAEIVKTLYYLPLAIVQAGAFILRSRNLGSYLNLYMKNQTQLLSEKPAQSYDHYAWTVYTTWEMSFDQLSPLAAMFLQHCSFLHFNGISEEIFRYASKYQFCSDGPSKEELQGGVEFLSHFLGSTGEWDSFQFTIAMNEVQAYSLISFDEETKLFSIHPLVHAWGQSTISDPRKYMHTMQVILGMAISERQEWDGALPSLVLCPHIELAVKSDMYLAPVFASHYAWVFREAGKYKQGARMLEAVLEEYKQILGENHPETVSTMSSLGNTYLELGDYQNAKDLQVIVLEGDKQVLGEDHPYTLLAIGNLGTTYQHLGDYQNAKDLQVGVLDKRKQILGEDHPDTIGAMSNLGSTYRQLGEYHNAKDLQITVLEKRKQILGEDHPDTLCAMGNLGITYQQLGDYQSAKGLEITVLEKRKQILGRDHPETLRAMEDLGSTYQCLEEYQNAKHLQVTVLDKRKQILGEDHPDTIWAMGNLGSIYRYLGDYQNAKDLQVTVLKRRKADSG